MRRSWRTVVEELAGPEAALEEGVSTELGMHVAQVVVPGALQSGLGATTEGAWESVANALGDLRLVQSLEAAGWVVVDEVVDEATYILTRDPQGTVWAIGVASSQYRRGYLESDMERDDHAERLAFVDPADTRSAQTLLAALADDL